MASNESDENGGKTHPLGSGASDRQPITKQVGSILKSCLMKMSPGPREPDPERIANLESEGRKRLGTDVRICFDVYKEYDLAWRHEDNLIAQRMTWLLTMQTFSFAACALLASKALEYAPSLAYVNGVLEYPPEHSDFKFRILVSPILVVALANMYLARRSLAALIAAFDYTTQLNAEIQTLFKSEPFPRLGHSWDDESQKRTRRFVAAVPVGLYVFWLFVLIGSAMAWLSPPYLECVLRGSLSDAQSCGFPSLP